MGFWDDLAEFGSAVIKGAAEALPKVKVLQKIQEWEEMDGEDVEDDIKDYVADSSVEELEVTHEMLGQRLKDNVWSEDTFQKILLIFGCFHRSWGVRDYRRNR